ncbi:nucleotidyltransferase family protein [Pontibacter amylolyticus]|uniref:Alcohol dehydrogenase n=1 Tax=Pontibacter amylolyticus TaxID=1424080 RepID=A0ABQ1WC18_9BACT|nr:nucleotidyltransferase family protein [Pontibacter amylolyticus]GGG25284.1 alcohol dehydrogenase [Pontibacter amylolyticus]
MEKLTYTNDVTLEEAIRLLDKNGNGFLPVVDTDNILIGIITDGDLRRAILNKSFEVESLINRNPVVASCLTPHKQVKQQLRKLHRRHMPLVDENKRLIEVVILDDFEVEPKPNWVVIMAGGLGSRLGNLTKDTPKPMLEVGGKPILQGIVEHFRSQGFHKFIFCVNYKSHVIENYFGDGKKFGIEVIYTKEEKKLGTAGALGLIDFDLKFPFFVVNGDVLATIDYDDFLNYHIVSKADATMCVKRYQHEVPYACVEFNDENSLLSLKEKPKYSYHINTGMYVLNPEIVEWIPKKCYYDMPTLFEDLVLHGMKKLKVFNTDEYWLDIGKPEDYEKGKSDLELHVKANG